MAYLNCFEVYSQHTALLACNANRWLRRPWCAIVMQNSCGIADAGVLQGLATAGLAILQKVGPAGLLGGLHHLHTTLVVRGFKWFSRESRWN